MYLVAFIFLFSLNNHHHHHHFHSSVKGTGRRRWEEDRKAWREEGTKGERYTAACSVQATPSEVVGDDDVGHGVKHNLDVPCICGAGHVTVDFLIWRAILTLKLCLDVSCCILIGVGSWRGKSNGSRCDATELLEKKQELKSAYRKYHEKWTKQVTLDLLPSG